MAALQVTHRQSPQAVESATPPAAPAWVTNELAARLEPDQGGAWHSQEEAAPRYQVGSVRRVGDVGGLLGQPSAQR